MSPSTSPSLDPEANLARLERHLSSLMSPIGLVGVVATSAFTIELLIMYGLESLPAMRPLETDLLDATLLTLFLSPVLYLFIFRPLRAHIRLLQDTQRNLLAQRDHLEAEVSLRTSELKEEKNLVESALEEIDDLYQNSPCGYHSLDKDGMLVRINDTELRWLGYAREEVLNKKRWMDFLTPGTTRVFTDNYPNLKRFGAVRDLEYELVRRDGSVMFGLLSATALYDPQGQFIMSRSTLFDITDRKLAERMVRESEARLKEMFENLSSAVAVYHASPDGRDFYFTTFNRAAERIENRLRSEVIGKNVVEAFPGIMEFGLLDVFRRVWKSGVAEHFPVALYHDGSIATWRENYVYKLPQGEVVAIYEDVTQQKQAEEKMRQQALYDMLTGLPNRTLLFDRVRQALARARRERTRCALMFLDLDKFKHVNDSLGHEMGDEVLIEAAQRLRGVLRESDTVARLGGDEFVVLLPAIAADDDAGMVAEKIRHAISRPFELSGHTLNLSTSIGIAIFPAHGGDEHTLVNSADAAMYAAKQHGGNRVQLHQAPALPDMAQAQTGAPSSARP